MTTNLFELLAHVISDPDRLKAAIGASEANKKVQASMPRWQAAADRASAYQREHPGQPLPAEVAGTLSEAIADVEVLQRLLEQALGSTMPEQSRVGFDAMKPFISKLRELLGPSEN